MRSVAPTVPNLRRNNCGLRYRIPVSPIRDEPRSRGRCRRVRLLLMLLLFAALPPWVSAQRYTFKVYGREEGLEDLNAVCLLQDRTGFLWVGTQDGLFRYDGSRFHGFGSTDGLPSTTINSLHESSDGTLWAGTAAGLAFRDGERFRTVELTKTAFVPGPTGIASDTNGRVFVATSLGLAVGSVQGGHRQFQYLPAAVPEKNVFSVAVDGQGMVWFGCGQSLCRLEGNRPVVLTAPGLIADRWGAILSDRDGSLWLRSFTRLLVRPAGSEEFVARDQGLPQASGRALGLDRQGNLISATSSGLAIRTGDQWRIIGQPQGLPQDVTYSVLQDREGSMWVGGSLGLARWLGYGQWEHWTQVQGLGNEVVWAIHRDAAGAVWVGTDGGLYRMSPGKPGWQAWTTRQNLAGDKVLSLASGADGALWAGSFPSGVSRIDPRSGAVRRYGPESGLPKDPVPKLLADRQGRLWVATSRGLFLGKETGAGMRFEELVPPHGDHTASWWGLLEDRQGRIWVSARQTLARWDNGQWTDFSGIGGLKSPCANTIAEGRDGSIWLGYCRPLGLARLDFSSGHTKIDHFDRQNGLRSSRVQSLGTDPQGWIWVGTSNGLHVFDGSRWRHLGEADGMLLSGVNAQAFFADPDGSVWMGTFKGISHFQPSDQSWPETPPPMTLTSAVYNVANRSFDTAFSALTFLNEKEVRFRYRLSGLETNWIETDQRQAMYHGLPPGNYTFEAMARSAQGVWSTQAARMSFRAPPAWWQTWWFRALAAAGILLAIWGAMLLVHQRRLARVRAELGRIMEERTRIARELHDTVLQEVTGVSMLLGPFERQAADPELREKLGFALSRLDRTIVETRRAVWALRPEALDRRRFPEALAEAGANLTAGSGIAFEFHMEGTPVPCSPELEGELLRIGQETIQNAVKHSQASLIRMRLEYAPDAVLLIAEDNGIGFGDGAAGQGRWGLTGIRERVERLGGEMTIESVAGKGTRVRVQVPGETTGRHSAGLEAGR